MIISASRRTDIPAYYFDWFMHRLEERYVLVRNPMNPLCVSHVDLSPDAVDCIVFWTKNPSPMLERLDELKDYLYYFQYTLTAYNTDVESNLPTKPLLVDTFKAISNLVGRERVIWRYDPILLNARYTSEYHIHQFEQLARRLAGYTEKCTISFIDFYPKISAAVKALGIMPISNEQKWLLAKSLSEIAGSCNNGLDTCAETIDLSDLNIGHAHCIDDQMISRIAGRTIRVRKDRNQRPACGCAESMDIGAYNTCLNGCRYCYANQSSAAVTRNRKLYDVQSPLLCSSLKDKDTIYERPKRSQQ